MLYTLESTDKFMSLSWKFGKFIVFLCSSWIFGYASLMITLRQVGQLLFDLSYGEDVSRTNDGTGNCIQYLTHETSIKGLWKECNNMRVLRSRAPQWRLRNHLRHWIQWNAATGISVINKEQHSTSTSIAPLISIYTNRSGKCAALALGSSYTAQITILDTVQYLFIHRNGSY